MKSTKKISLIYYNTNSYQLFCKNSNLNLANFTKLLVFRVNSWKFYPNPWIFLHKCHLWQIPCLSQPGPNGFGIVPLVQRIKPKLFWQKWNSRGKCLKKVFFYNRVQQLFFQPKEKLKFQWNCCSFKKEQLWTLSRCENFSKPHISFALTFFVEHAEYVREGVK